MQSKVKVVNLGRKFLALRWLDPESGRECQKSARTVDRKQAEKLAAQLEAELNEGRYSAPSRVSWEEFRERYENEKLRSLAPKSEAASKSALNHIETLIRPSRLAELTSNALSTFQARLRQTGIKETSIATHLRHVRAALSWAKAVGLLVKLPDVQMPKRAKGQNGKLMRGRPITAEEFDRLLEVVPAVRPNDVEPWRHYLTGLWLSGLRLGESLLLSWEMDSAIAVDLSGRWPRFRIWAEAEKGHQDRLLPMTPDFAEFLWQTTDEQRCGTVFKLNGLLTGDPITPKRVGRILSEIGKKAGVVVNKSEGKFSTAHDLRRAFGTRWAAKVKPATLQLLMRHESIETTLRYYVSQDADDISRELWQTGSYANPTTKSTVKE